jgi:hypothetical protein
MTPDDFKLLCVRYGLVASLHCQWPNGCVYCVYSLRDFPTNGKILGSFAESDLSVANFSDVEAQVVEWSLEAAFGVVI